MAYKLTVLNHALLELEEAIAWYEEISKELSTDLVVKYLDTQKRVWQKPLSAPQMKGGYRKMNLKRFPFKVVYRVLKNEIVVVAFAHHKRKQHYWRKR